MVQVTELLIRKVTNGHIIQAGCQTFVFDNPRELAVELTEWLTDPEKVEARYREKYKLPSPIPPNDAPMAMGVTAQECNARDPRVPHPVGLR